MGVVERVSGRRTGLVSFLPTRCLFSLLLGNMTEEGPGVIIEEHGMLMDKLVRRLEELGSDGESIGGP